MSKEQDNKPETKPKKADKEVVKAIKAAKDKAIVNNTIVKK